MGLYNNNKTIGLFKNAQQNSMKKIINKIMIKPKVVNQ